MKKIQDLCLIINRDEPSEAEIANDNGAINISIRNSKHFTIKLKL